MTQPVVFISYSHADEKEKDELLCHLRVLQDAGSVDIWSDDRIRAGSDWRQEYREALTQAKVAILLISANFLNSNFILSQELPTLLKRHEHEGLIIFPVIAKACAWRGIDWLAELNVRPQDGRAIWSSVGHQVGEELAAIAKEINMILKESSSLTEFAPTSPVTSPAQPGPVPIESPYGTMLPNSKFYIERESDSTCWKYLSQAHAVTIFVQGPPQMGKSSLMRRMTHRAKEYNVATAFIDFQKFTEQQLVNEEEFLIALCMMIGDALRISEAIDQYWGSRRRSNIVKCSNYVSQHIIPHLSTPFILAMDETERLLTSPIRTDFFGMLRTWHNDRAWDENFAQMTLFLSSSTEPHLFIDNPNQSPFNVAEPISLRDFTLAEVEELNRRHGAPLNQAQVNELVNLLGGHPFLTRLALYLLVTRRFDFNTLLATATSDTGPFGEHLRHYWWHVLDMPKVKQALARICRHQTYPEDKFYYRLKGAGLIEKDGPQVMMRNKLYERYFAERLNG